MKAGSSLSLHTLGVAVFAALGTFLFVSCLVLVLLLLSDTVKGFDTGILTTSTLWIGQLMETDGFQQRLPIEAGSNTWTVQALESQERQDQLDIEVTQKTN